MKKFIIISAVCLLTLTACGTSSSENSSENTDSLSTSNSASTSDPATKDIFAMDTYMTLTAYGENANEVLEKCEDRITEIENELSVTNENSDIYKINSNQGKEITVSDDTAEILSDALEYCQATNGALDITTYPIVKEWGFTTGDYQIPAKSTLENLLQYVDYTKVSVNGNEVEIPENYMIDTGAVTKGYTSDSIYEIMEENGITSGIINLGGNVRLVGSKTDGSDWKVGIQDPYNSSDYLGIVTASDISVITSGNYERYFDGEDGQRYWHIIDPTTGSSARNGTVSTTIISQEGVMCDALSTATFVMGVDEAEKFWKNSDYDFGMIIVTDDNCVYVTENVSDIFECTQDYDVKIISK